jgi:hypothetical protein
MQVFISHITEEAQEANALKHGIEKALPGIEVFVSSSDLVLGDTWLAEILKQLDTANIMLTLCSPGSIRQPWINFESGIAYAKKAKVIPVCYKGLSPEQLPDPLAIFQTFELKRATACTHLVNFLSSTLKLSVAENFNPVDMLDSINQATQVKSPLNTDAIGIILSHRQDQWEKNRNSVFNLPQSLPIEFRNKWDIKKIEEEQTFIFRDLFQYVGIILAMPWHAKINPEAINALVEWVYSGGRLLLLGFEFGDRHHDSNLSELSHRFGIDPTSGDIVGQKTFRNDGGTNPVMIHKPYGSPVMFSAQDSPPHPFNELISGLTLRNVQTVRVDPGGREWLHVGENVAYRPGPDSVQYNDRIMSTPGINMVEQNEFSSWLPVAVEAPRGLCGKGGVNMIGTWDLIGQQQFFSGDNLILIERLLNWLTHKVDN